MSDPMLEIRVQRDRWTLFDTVKQLIGLVERLEATIEADRLTMDDYPALTMEEVEALKKAKTLIKRIRCGK